jgi:hypothetical protein
LRWGSPSSSKADPAQPARPSSLPGLSSLSSTAEGSRQALFDRLDEMTAVSLT